MSKKSSSPIKIHSPEGIAYINNPDNWSRKPMTSENQGRTIRNRSLSNKAKPVLR